MILNKGKVAEIFGVAGSGKSTFAKYNQDYEILQISLLAKVCIYTWAVLSNVNRILFSGREFKKMELLRIMCHIYYKLEVVALYKRFKTGSFLYDQGPIYHYVQLRRRMNKYQIELPEKELDHILEQIRTKLDDSIFLECDSVTSMHRVKKREKNHYFKILGRIEILEEIRSWEVEFEQVADQLSSKKMVSNEHTLENTSAERAILQTSTNA